MKHIRSGLLLVLLTALVVKIIWWVADAALGADRARAGLDLRVHLLPTDAVVRFA